VFSKRPRQPRSKRPLSLRLYNRFLHKYYAHDVAFELQLMARREAALYIREHMSAAGMHADRWRLLDAAIAAAPRSGLFLEFGVEKGASANFIAARLAAQRAGAPLHAFDSFEGLPEDWLGTPERAGKFSLHGRVPVLLPNVVVHRGWFDETLPRFRAAQPSDNVALVHIDCDLYSSTRSVLEHLGDLLAPGSIVVFDEYFNYHGWQNHEFKAWQEYARANAVDYSYRGFCARGGHVFIRIEGLNGETAVAAAPAAMLSAKS
jgi:predicted O-methyltransferase YrrM